MGYTCTLPNGNRLWCRVPIFIRYDNDPPPNCVEGVFRRATDASSADELVAVVVLVHPDNHRFIPPVAEIPVSVSLVSDSEAALAALHLLLYKRSM